MIGLLFLDTMMVNVNNNFSIKTMMMSQTSIFKPVWNTWYVFCDDNGPHFFFAIFIGRYR